MNRHVLALLFLVLPSLAAADWRSDADARIERLRKGDFTVEVRDAAGAPIGGATVSYQLKRHAFLFGTAIAYAPFADQGEDGRQYRQFILDHFSALVCENEMKWYSTEVERGHEDYAQADALLAFAAQNGLRMRGHCLFWEKQKYAMPWLVALNPADLKAAVEHRLTATASRYAGRLASWDVDNEALDGSFFRERLGADFMAWMFKETARLDPKTPLFVNEYAILGNPEKTTRLLALVKDLQAKGATVGGIGIQSHDSDRLTTDREAAPMSGERPEWMMKARLTPEMFLATLDRLYAETRLPIHLTEISAKTPDAVRRGEVVAHGWKLGGRAFKNMMKSPRAPAANDIVPDLEQKGVDLRIGLDIARLALREMVDIIVVVTGDSDLVPAFRFARREGVRVFLDHMGHGVRRELKAHADIII